MSVNIFCLKVTELSWGNKMITRKHKWWIRDTSQPETDLYRSWQIGLDYWQIIIWIWSWLQIYMYCLTHTPSQNIQKWSMAPKLILSSSGLCLTTQYPLVSSAAATFLKHIAVSWVNSFLQTFSSTVLWPFLTSQSSVSSLSAVGRKINKNNTFCVNI